MMGADKDGVNVWWRGGGADVSYESAHLTTLFSSLIIGIIEKMHKISLSGIIRLSCNTI